MRKIKPHLTPAFMSANIEDGLLAESAGVYVDTYFELRRQMAQLACANSDYILFYRGQKQDYTDSIYRKGGSSFFPSIYRGQLSYGELQLRWNKLNKACLYLLEELSLYRKKLPPKSPERKELDLVIRKRLLLWSLLQHYEVVDTPLLDVTQSLRIACSFAFLDLNEEYAYIYAFGLPYNTGRISINSEHYLTNIRLLSIAPSGSLRPHYQEGFLIGEDEINEHEKKNITLDFRRRLIGKFKVPNSPEFWHSTYIKNDMPVNFIDRALAKEELYPDIDNNKDIIARICNVVKERMTKYDEIEIDNPDYSIEAFLSIWQQIESGLRDVYGNKTMDSKFTPFKAIRIIDSISLRDDLNQLRLWRNNLVHNSSISLDDLPNKINMAKLLLLELNDYLNKKAF